MAVGEVETLRLRTARSGLSIEKAISFAGVPAMFDCCCSKNVCCICL